MASVDIQKHCSGSIGNIVGVHIYREKDDGHAHSNESINSDLTQQNFSMMGLDKDEVIKKVNDLRKKYDELIPPKRVKKDRKTYYTLNVPCPASIPKDKRDDFFVRAYEELNKVFDGQFIDGVVHKDEVHSYIDPNTKEERQSLEHMHIIGVPFDDEKGLNMKACITREKLTEMNKVMVDLCREEFNLEWNVGTGKSKLEVEELKANSLKAEIELKEDLVNKVEHDLNNKKDDLQKTETKVNELNLEKDSITESIADLTIQNKKLQKGIDKRDKIITQKNEEIKELNGQIKGLTIFKNVCDKLAKLKPNLFGNLNKNDANFLNHELTVFCRKAEKYDAIKKENDDLLKYKDGYCKLRTSCDKLNKSIEELREMNKHLLDARDLAYTHLTDKKQEELSTQLFSYEEMKHKMYLDARQKESDRYIQSVLSKAERSQSFNRGRGMDI